MKIELFDASKAKAPEQILRLRLCMAGTEAILVAVDEQGTRIRSGDMLAITPDGVRLYTSFSSKPGLPLDENGRVKVTNYR